MSSQIVKVEHPLAVLHSGNFCWKKFTYIAQNVNLELQWLFALVVQTHCFLPTLAYFFIYGYVGHLNYDDCCYFFSLPIVTFIISDRVFVESVHNLIMLPMPCRWQKWHMFCRHAFFTVQMHCAYRQWHIKGEADWVMASGSMPKGLHAITDLSQNFSSCFIGPGVSQLVIGEVKWIERSRWSRPSYIEWPVWHLLSLPSNSADSNESNNLLWV